MIKDSCDVLLIGGGLSGLATAYYLRDSGLSIKIIESRKRLGGRIHTIYKEGQAPLEMGATWLGSKHNSLSTLLEELGLEVFPQLIGNTAIYEAISTSPHYLAQLPPNPEPTLRIKGGSSALIDALASNLDSVDILLSEKVEKIISAAESLLVKTESRTIKAGTVISTVPPNLLLKVIEFEPALPPEVVDLAKATHTWMGESIKVALTYREAFWRASNLSGTIISNVGPIPEMYDHSNVEDNLYALKGFFSSNYYGVSREERLALVLTQLRKYYGNKADDFISYEETVWRNETETFAPYSENVLPHQNNGHSLYRNSYMNNKMYISGTETARSFPGYMDGAVSRALEISNLLTK
jgi:monoamine oxidase